MRTFSNALAFAALLLSTPAFAQAAPAATKVGKPAKQPWLYEGSDVPVDDTWTFGVLPNGVRYAVKKNDVPAGQVSIRVRIDAGALHENNDEQGFAHLIEHLSFRGSTFVPDGEAMPKRHRRRPFTSLICRTRHLKNSMSQLKSFLA